MDNPLRRYPLYRWVYDHSDKEIAIFSNIPYSNENEVNKITVFSY